MHCLIIDDNPKTAGKLRSMLQADTSVTTISLEIQPRRYRQLLVSENIDLVFIRVRLWDFRQFEELENIPCLVFLNGGKDKLAGDPGTGVHYSFREPYYPMELGQLLRKIQKEKRKEDPAFFFIRHGGRFHKTAFSGIEMIEAKRGNYVVLHLESGEQLMPGNIAGWMRLLPPDRFIRISDRLIIPASELPKVTGNFFEFKGRVIRLSFRFASSARKEMEGFAGS